MRPVIAATASRLHCCNDYASARPAPTSGTNSTFGCLRRHAQDQAAGESKASAGVPLTPGWRFPPSRSRFPITKETSNRPACPIYGIC